jgi:hypothetical protein
MADAEDHRWYDELPAVNLQPSPQDAPPTGIEGAGSATDLPPWRSWNTRTGNPAESMAATMRVHGVPSGIAWTTPAEAPRASATASIHRRRKECFDFGM